MACLPATKIYVRHSDFLNRLSRAEIISLKGIKSFLYRGGLAFLLLLFFPLYALATESIITTRAGNGTPGSGGDDKQAVQAQLQSPRGVAMDRQGNLYIADTENHRIRKVDRQGVITTVAGKGTPGYSGDEGKADEAELERPMGITADAKSNLYIADTGNHCIRKVDPGGIITTIAGDGTEGGAGDYYICP
ncbi:MAG: hypothetical protein GY862_23875 [Gammaproteobacteria bacterium]|nr:hypothetical protein [Gammaproteobacteria bacterium]